MLFNKDAIIKDNNYTLNCFNKDDEFFTWAKFWFSAIIYAEVIVNKSFSTGKLLSPRP